MRQEIRTSLELDPADEILLDHHSLLNLFNVLELQLERISAEIPEAKLREFSDFCLEILLNLSRKGILQQLPAMMDNCHRLRESILQLKEIHAQHVPLLDTVLEIINSGHARLCEYQGDRFAWQTISADTFRETLALFLEATSKVSNQRFAFVFSPEQPRRDAYWIEFKTEPEKSLLSAPPVLHDTIRDLVGNARKYSHPGAQIRIHLSNPSPRSLRLSISDDGMGIPEEEISKVVRFGYRATNVLDRRTMGGGFGLTKAYNLCRKSGGRFFIASTLGQGTTVEMTLNDATAESGIP